MNERSGRRRGLWMLAQAKAVEPGHSKLLFEQSRRVVRLEHPVIEPRLDGPEPVQLARSRHR